MDLSRLLGLVVKGALGGKRKKSRKTQRWVSSGRGSPLLTSGALLTAAGVAWGLFETWQKQRNPQGQQSPQNQQSPQGPPSQPKHQQQTGGTPAVAEAPAAIDPILRLVRLTVAAARADGTLSERERETILDHARQAGVEDVVLRELDAPLPVAEIVRGVAEPSQKRDLYALAYTIVRADEDVSHVERIWLAQLTVHLGIDAHDAARIESEIAERIGATTEA